MPERKTISQLKQLKQAGAITEASEHKEASKFAPVPMFLPTETFGRNVVSVQTRQSFLSPNIGWWIRYRVTRFGAVAAGIVALLLLPINGIAAAVAGLGAGYLYGQHLWADFYINQMLKSRRLLETT